MTAPVDSTVLVRLLQLASPALPVGAYAYSQGQEWAVAAGWIHDEASLARWLDDQLAQTLARVDLPILARLHAAATRADDEALGRWSRVLIALRETRELAADDCDRGRALVRLLRDLGVASAAAWMDGTAAAHAIGARGVPFAAATALAAAHWQLPLAPTLHAYAFGWLENQVLAGVKLVPLGQVAGQRVLLALAERIPSVVDAALTLADDDLGGTLPIVAIASSLHETQYTRLFRS